MSCAGSSVADTNSLIISEVHLESLDSENNWIEVYNPTDKPLNLFQFRTSHVWTKNMMPVKYRDTIVAAGEYAIICANKNMFDTVTCPIIEIPFFSSLTKGGFVLIGSKEELTDEQYTYNAIRYGDPSLTEKYQSKFGEFVAQFANHGMSYQRVEPFIDKQYELGVSNPAK